MATQATIGISGLTPLEAEELRAALVQAGGKSGELDVKPEAGEVGGARKGEPFTMFAAIVVSQLALTALTIYLAKRRATARKKETLFITLPDGTRIEHQVEAESTEAEIKADLMGKIGELKIPLPPGTGA